MANVTYTFTAGTKAQSAQVNKNFDDCITGINKNEDDIADIKTDVSTLQNTKANKNGSSSERFSVANPTTSYEAVNKQYLEEYTSFINDYIKGMVISRSSADTIIVTAGSCLNSTRAQTITLTSSVSKQQSPISASTTYYVYAICNSDNTTSDVLISTESTTPALPSGYSYFRQIGLFYTNSNSEISAVSSYSSSSNISGSFPNYSAGVSKTRDTWYQAESDGYILFGIGGDHQQSGARIGSSTTVYTDFTCATDTNFGFISMQPVAKGMYYQTFGYSHYYNGSFVFIPCIGA